MPEIDLAIAGLHSAVSDMLDAADRASLVWTVPRAPGKWSPSQVVEHVARLMDQMTKVAAGEPSGFPTLPRLLRPLVRYMFMTRALSSGVFPNGKKTIPEFDPATGSPTPADARLRLATSLGAFDHACRMRAGSGEAVPSTMFGRVPVVDFVRFQELHVRHHLQQMPSAETSKRPRQPA